MAMRTRKASARSAEDQGESIDARPPLKAKRMAAPRPSPLDSLPVEVLARKVLRSKRWPLFPTATWRAIERSLDLSGSEFTIVLAAFEDLSDKEIAKRIRMPYGTVRSHFDRLNHKLGVHSRASLILKVVREYLKVADGRRRGK